MTDYTNWQKEKAKLKTELLKDLRDQQDRRAELLLRGRITFDPRSPSTMLGPFYFRSNFKTAPSMSFEDVVQDPSNPCLFKHYIAKWHTTNTVIDGFYLGLYPISSQTTVTTHTVTWLASGTASRYATNTTSDRWTSSYNNDTPAHLIQTQYDVAGRDT